MNTHLQLELLDSTDEKTSFFSFLISISKYLKVQIFYLIGMNKYFLIFYTYEFNGYFF